MTALILFLISANSSYFLKLTPGVMSQGLAGSSVMIDEGLAVFHNPAHILDTKLNFTLSRWLYALNSLTMGATYRDYGIGISYLNYGSIQGYDENGVPTTYFTPYDVCLALARKLGPIGIVIKTFRESIGDYALYGLCGGLSAYVDFGKIAIGGKVDNLGKEFSRDASIPYVVAIGSRFSLPDNIDLFIETKAPDIEISSGLLYKYQIVKVLFGVKYLRSKNSRDQFSDLHLSGGLIIHVEKYDIGYALNYTEFSMAHQFSIQLTP